ncbi:protein of unknown function [Candidatus Methylomirabilis oxygeniifera]|uniref:Uncharacterized protein n=1 Tax=Methylomirabilis oxygeniifera TaxID=671143 RepID=D5MFF2_METO1|nr:protein of unknown function [Candidatus Methylomirabilis oxyfera]
MRLRKTLSAHYGSLQLQYLVAIMKYPTESCICLDSNVLNLVGCHHSISFSVGLKRWQCGSQ